jgi:DNA-directed RNA polymerase subunit RPC12/RpoP
MKKEKVLCENCGAENAVVFQDAIDMDNKEPSLECLKGRELAVYICWRCHHTADIIIRQKKF